MIDLKTVLKINKIQSKNLETNKSQNNNILQSKPEIPLSNGLIPKKNNSKEKNRDRFESYDFINNNCSNNYNNSSSSRLINKCISKNQNNKTIDTSIYNFEDSKKLIYYQNYDENLKVGKEIFKSDKKNLNFVISTQSDKDGLDKLENEAKEQMLPSNYKTNNNTYESLKKMKIEHIQTISIHSKVKNEFKEKVYEGTILIMKEYIDNQKNIYLKSLNDMSKINEKLKKELIEITNYKYSLIKENSKLKIKIFDILSCLKNYENNGFVKEKTLNVSLPLLLIRLI